MHTNQKRILIAVIALVAGMLLYPPFQRVASSGAISNMGYGWIFEPPGGNATVNVSILLIQWIGVLVVGGLGFFLAKESSPSNSPGPKGVGGWLLLLVAGMMFLGPLLGAGRIAGNIFTAEQQFPALKASEQWGTYTSATWLIFLAAAAASVYGGWGLLRGKDWSVVSRAKLILWISGPAASLVLGVLVPKMTLGEWGVDAKIVVGLIASVIATAIWTAYLSRSKRVRNTYSALADSADIPHKFVGNLPTIPTVVTTAPRSSGPTAPMNSATHESDDWAYERIAQEIESGNRDKATWTRAFANAGGDDKQTTALYIKLRVEKLKAISEAEETPAAKQIEEVTPLESEAPVVDKAVNASSIETQKTIGVAIGVAMSALILLLVVLGAKSPGALGPVSTPTPTVERPVSPELPRVEAPTPAPAPVPSPIAENYSPSPLFELIAEFGTPAIILQNHKCLGCHSLNRKVVGPSFRDIAAKYKDRSDAVDILTSKVKKGGSGAWGTVPMPPNQNVPESDIRELVESILKIR